MKLQIEQNHLQSLLAKVIGAVNKKNTIPILANVKLQATDTLQATSTDLDMEITARTIATVTEQGATTVPAEMFNGIVAKLPKGSLVSMSESKGYLYIEAGRSKFKLATLPASDFPAMANATYDATLNFNGYELRNAIEKTAWAASTDETRYFLQGIAMQYRDGKANFVATDGHRLAWYVDGDVSDFPSVIIPSATAKQFKTLLDDGAATIEVSETKIKLTFGDLSIVSKVIDGTYPDWTRIIPEKNANSITLASIDAKQAIERVTTVATDRTKAVRFGVLGGELTLTVQDATGGSATEVMTVEQVGNDADIGMNSKYALDAFAQADKGDVTIHYGSGMDPMLVKYEKEPGLTAVVMPMRA